MIDYKNYKTGVFATTSGEYMKILLQLWLPGRVWMFVAPVALFAALGVRLHDARFLILALIVVMVVGPMGMPLFFYYYMLAPEARRAVLLKSVEANEDGLELKYFNKEGRELRLPPDEMIGWKDVKGVRRTGRGFVYVLRGERLQFLFVPYEAIGAEGSETSK